MLYIFRSFLQGKVVVQRLYRVVIVWKQEFNLDFVFLGAAYTSNFQTNFRNRLSLALRSRGGVHLTGQV